MQVLKQRLGRDHFCSINPIYQSSSRSNGEFASDDHSIEFEFQTQHHIADLGVGSPPLWVRKASRNAKHPPPLHNHPNYSFPSPTRRLQAIMEGRKALMGMVADMSESCQELSLKDLADDRKGKEEADQEVRKVDSTQKSRPRAKYDPKSKHTKKRQISRSESMGSGVFLLKMFVPVTPGSKRNSKRKTCPKISPKPSLEVAERWNCLCRSTSSSSRSPNRPFSSCFQPAWWSFNSKPRQRGCLF